MTALAAFCGVTVAFLVLRDLFLPDTRDVEVWFGFELRGMPALLTAPLHWAIFAAGAWGFGMLGMDVPPRRATPYKSRSPCLERGEPNGQGWVIGLAQAAALAIPGFVLLRAHRAQQRR